MIPLWAQKRRDERRREETSYFFTMTIAWQWLAVIHVQACSAHYQIICSAPQVIHAVQVCSAPYQIICSAPQQIARSAPEQIMCSAHHQNSDLLLTRSYKIKADITEEFGIMRQTHSRINSVRLRVGLYSTIILISKWSSASVHFVYVTFLYLFSHEEEILSIGWIYRRNVVLLRPPLYTYKGSTKSDLE
jgi:hypothetical protein